MPVNNSLISVIIPCYNQAVFLPDCVKSIVKQTYNNWEIIIVNDGSPDNTSDIARQLAERNPDKKIYLLEKTNGGLSDARNAGIIKAKGEWILPLDSDDLFEPGFMEKAIDLINTEPELNLVTTNLISFGTAITYWNPPEYSAEYILEKNVFIYASLFKKELWVKTGGYEKSLPWGAEDWNFWISCSKYGINSKKIKENLFKYHSNTNESMLSKMINYFDEVKAMIKTLHPDLYPQRSLIESYTIISTMHADTVEQIKKKTEQFKELYMPYFWLGLYYEGQNKMEEAMLNYQLAADLALNYDWQPFLRLSVLYKRFNNREAAQKNFNEVQKRKKLIAENKSGKWKK